MSFGPSAEGHAQRMVRVARDLEQFGYWTERRSLAGMYPEWHRHPGYEIVWTSKGYGDFLFADRTVAFGPGEVVLLNGAIDHSMRVHGGALHGVLAYLSSGIVADPLWDGGLVLDRIESAPATKVKPSPDTWAKIDRWLDAVAWETRHRRSNWRAAVVSYLRLALIHLDRDLPPQGEGLRGDNVVGQLIAFIDEHLSEPVSLEHLSRKFNMSSRQMQRQFKSAIGTPVKAFWAGRRLEHAARLLRKDATIEEAARQSGYTSIAAFSRAFKRRFGISPSQARERPLHLT